MFGKQNSLIFGRVLSFPDHNGMRFFHVYLQRLRPCCGLL